MLRSLALLFVAGVMTLVPMSASAATVNFFGPIIPDGTNGQPNCNCDANSTENPSEVTSAPDWGCVLQTIQNAIAVGISFVVTIITLSIAYAGIMIMANPNNPGQRENGRSLVMNAVIGLIIVLTAWLIVDFVMKAFYNPGAATPFTKGKILPWYAIISDDSGGKFCLQPKELPGLVDPDAVDGGGALNPVPAGTTPTTPTTPTSTATPKPPTGTTPQDPVVTTAPPAPTGFNVSLTGTTATVLWTKATSGVTTYTIERWKAGDTAWTQIATVPLASAGSYANANLSPGTKYSYRIFAWNGTKNSPNGQILDVTTAGTSAGTGQTTATVPPNPTSLTASLSGSTKINLSWTAVAGATSYQLDLATTTAGGSAPTTNSAYKSISSPSGTSYSYTIPSPGTSASYFFRLWAKNGLTYSKAPASNSVTIRTGTSSGGDTTPTTPTTTSPAGCSSCSKVSSGYLSKAAPNGCDLSGGNDGVSVISPALTSCYVNATLDTRLKNLTNPDLKIPSSSWQVTEMWPPTRAHAAECHANGTCVDLSFINESDRSNNEKIYNLLQAFSSVSLAGIYEFKTKTACESFLADYPSASSRVDVVTSQTGSGHYSVYTSSSELTRWHSPGCN